MVKAFWWVSMADEPKANPSWEMRNHWNVYRQYIFIFLSPPPITICHFSISKETTPLIHIHLSLWMFDGFSVARLIVFSRSKNKSLEIFWWILNAVTHWRRLRETTGPVNRIKCRVKNNFADSLMRILAIGPPIISIWFRFIYQQHQVEQTKELKWGDGGAWIALSNFSLNFIIIVAHPSPPAN